LWFARTDRMLLAGATAYAGQVPFAAGVSDFPISGRDRVYAAEQFSDTVSVIDPSTNKNLGVIRLDGAMWPRGITAEGAALRPSK
jgi:YVTN family beta-propeller protein